MSTQPRRDARLHAATARSQSHVRRCRQPNARPCSMCGPPLGAPPPSPPRHLGSGKASGVARRGVTAQLHRPLLLLPVDQRPQRRYKQRGAAPLPPALVDDDPHLHYRGTAAQTGLVRRARPASTSQARAWARACPVLCRINRRGGGSRSRRAQRARATSHTGRTASATTPASRGPVRPTPARACARAPAHAAAAAAPDRH